MDKIDPNHDIVPTLRMFDGLIMGQAADEIEKLRGRQQQLLELLYSAKAIASRRGGNTSWALFEKALVSAGVTAPTPRTFRSVHGDPLPSNLVVLSGKEIRDLAKAAGLVLDKHIEYSADVLEDEMVIRPCPTGGVREDDEKDYHYRYVTHFEEYPEGGVLGLGDPLPAQEQEKPQEPVADKQPLALNAQTQPMWDYLVSQSKYPLRWETYLDIATKVRERVGANQYQPVGANDTMKLYAVINPEGEIRYVDFSAIE